MVELTLEQELRSVDGSDKYWQNAKGARLVSLNEVHESSSRTLTLRRLREVITPFLTESGWSLSRKRCGKVSGLQKQVNAVDARADRVVRSSSPVSIETRSLVVHTESFHMWHVV